MKEYIGEGKSAKHFAKEYVERRSRYKNALKQSGNRVGDDLLTPAAAINPSDDFEFAGAGNSSAGFTAVGAGGKGGKNKKKGRGNNKSKDASHLLGFSVQSNRINAGELDHPQ